MIGHTDFERLEDPDAPKREGKTKKIALLGGVSLVLIVAIACLFAFYDTSDDPQVRARKVLEYAPVIDTHNDLPWGVRELNALNRLDANVSGVLPLDTDLVRAKAGALRGQFWSVWVPCHPVQLSTETVLQQIDLVRRMGDAYADQMEVVESVSGVRDAWGQRKFASLIGMEGGHPLNGSLALLRQFRRLGVRYMTLTHTCSTSWAESSQNERYSPRQSPFADVHGLTSFGRSVVAEMNRIGMIVDLSHVSAEAMKDALAVSRAPVIFSHSSARALTNVTRNVPDEVFPAIMANGGVVHVNFYCGFISDAARALEEAIDAELPDASSDEQAAVFRERIDEANCTVSTVADHVMYLVSHMSADHVGFGGDFDGVSHILPKGLEDVSKYPHLITELMRRGLSDADVAKITSGNILRVLGLADKVAEQLAQEETPQAYALNATHVQKDDTPPERTTSDCTADICHVDPEPCHTSQPVPKPNPGADVHRGAVAADSADCSNLGAALLKMGGHAVDAAVGTALCLGIVHPLSSGIGGGGFMTVFDAATGDAVAIDMREMAPAAATESMFVDSPWSSTKGPRACGVPGELRGLQMAHSMFGRLPWYDVVKPAAEMASNGFRVDQVLAKALQSVKKRRGDRNFNAFFDMYDPDVVVEGATIKNEALGRTLWKIARRGADEFYTGQTARDLVHDVQALGGILTERDMHSYFAELSPAQRTTFRNATVLGANLPAAGSAILAAMLNIVDEYPASAELDGVTIHRMVEAMKFGFADRGSLGDPAFVDVSSVYPRMLSGDDARANVARLDDDKTSSDPKYYGAEVMPPPKDHGTSSFSIIDAHGSAVTMTTTVNLLFGSMVLSPSTGVLLNDQMDDFSVDPNKPNAFGLEPNKANYVAPRKRPMSSMSPTILLHPGVTPPRAWIAVGASGGPTIPTSCFQVIVGLVDRNEDPALALGVPRLHHQLLPMHVLTEPGYNATLIAALRARGHVVQEQTGSLGDGQKLGVAQFVVQPLHVKDQLNAQSDPRKHGIAKVLD